MALLKGKGGLKKAATKASKVEAAKSGRFRVVHAIYLGQHDTKGEAVAELNKVKLKNDDIAFIVEEKT